MVLSSKIIYVSIFTSVVLSCGNLDEVMKTVESVMTETSTTPTNFEIGNGLKEALIKGTSVGVDQLSQSGGYLNAPKFKIPFPKDAEKIENTLRTIGLGGEVDKVVVSLNRAAESAVVEAKPLFVNAIKEMTIQDVREILFGTDTAATAYLKQKTSNPLASAFQPKIQQSLDQVNATKYWNDIVSTYNKIPMVEKMNPDLANFVTERALKGLFMQIASEEIAIRENPMERTTALLEKVFGYAAEEKSN